jgi:hypothetical protein
VGIAWCSLGYNYYDERLRLKAPHYSNRRFPRPRYARFLLPKSDIILHPRYPASSHENCASL